MFLNTGPKESSTNNKQLVPTSLIAYILLSLVWLGSAPAQEALRVMPCNIHMWEPGVEALTEVIKASITPTTWPYSGS